MAPLLKSPQYQRGAPPMAPILIPYLLYKATLGRSYLGESFYSATTQQFRGKKIPNPGNCSKKNSLKGPKPKGLVIPEKKFGKPGLTRNIKLFGTF